MAILRVKQIREMKPEEISKKIYDIKLELMKEFGNVRMGRPIKNSGKIREMRRTLARLETLKRQKGAAKKNG
ncbi:MAG: 50S ribosomal protein L29 [Candidatus Aenigmarchaeota archaeon]|nr:50S ribosomal protein L29 [Candidatus Aenigmarchaeota archaeon]